LAVPMPRLRSRRAAVRRRRRLAAARTAAAALGEQQDAAKPHRYQGAPGNGASTSGAITLPSPKYMRSRGERSRSGTSNRAALHALIQFRHSPRFFSCTSSSGSLVLNPRDRA
jgi:hypothetical protein